MKFQDFSRHFEIDYIPIFYRFTTALVGGVLTGPSLNPVPPRHVLGISSFR